ATILLQIGHLFETCPHLDTAHNHFIVAFIYHVCFSARLSLPLISIDFINRRQDAARENQTSLLLRSPFTTFVPRK
ncbi:hypothetical protein LJC35_05120, partial [Parabacteroides sp. OttesenSCG-928-N08]|nr:hypothetical protein [Parabacteroides sp. OttesenSCG-928-N08]